MSKWEPEDYSESEIANAIYNLAAATDRQARAIDDLLYGLKYSKGTGMSIAEAIVVAGNAIAGIERPRDELE